MPHDVEHINHIIENFPDLIFWKNMNFIYQGCNTNVANLLGYINPSEIIGKTDEDLAKELNWSAERLIKLNETDKLIIEKGIEVSEEESIPFNNNIKIYLSSKKPLYKNGRITGILGILTDITHRKKIEDELKEAKEKNEIYLHSIVENLPQLVYWKDKNLIYQGCNHLCAEILNLQNPAQIVGKSDNDFGWSKERIEVLHEVDRQILENGTPQVVEDEIPIKNIKRMFLTSKTPLINKNGEIVGVLGISTDISDMKKMEAALKKAKEAAEAAARAKTEFIANMSHDIRTPLTGVIGLSNLLHGQLENPEHKQEANLLSKSGEQLLTMLNEILDDVRADTSHEADIFEETFDLFKCIQDLIELESPTTTSKHLGLNCNIKPDVPQYIVSDRKKIHHILLNLLGNAVKFTKNGHITIEVNCLDSTASHVHLQFGVADTGIGIPQALQNKVFERFFRVDPSYKGRYEGYGLGLHIVQSYVSILGGHVTLSSKEGEGTTFYFDVTCAIGEKDEKTIQPIIETPSSSPPILSQKETSQPNTQNAATVLLVEDDPIALIVVESLARNVGFAFLSAKDGETALELVKSHDFKLIITDLGLPGISGMALTQAIREWEHTQHKTPATIVGLSAHAQDEIVDECIAMGMNNGFSKPITLDTMETLKKTYIDCQ